MPSGGEDIAVGEDTAVMDAAHQAAGGKLPRLLLKGGLAITDQALFSGANFLVSVLLARRLDPGGYGAFSLANSAFLLIAALHQALLIEPMMIFGAGKHSARFSRYVWLLTGFHAALLVPLSLALWGVAALLGRYYSLATRDAFEGAALACGFMLLFWLVRRIFYVLMKPAWGAIGSLLYLLLLAAIIAVLWMRQDLTPWSAFVSMGLASLLASAAVLARFALLPNPQSAPPASSAPLSFRDVVSGHWGYGRWAMGSALMSWFPSNIYYVLLAAWLGLDGVGALRAVTNFVMPVLQAIGAVNMLMIPSLVRDLHAGGVPKMERGMLLFLKLYGVGCLLYLSALWLLRGHLFQWLYGGRYIQYAGWPLLLAGALPLVSSIYAVIGNGLRALERPDRMLWAFFGSSAAAVVFGIPLTAKFGVSGALLGNHFSAIVFIAALWWAYKSVRRAAPPDENRRAATPAE